MSITVEILLMHVEEREKDDKDGSIIAFVGRLQRYPSSKMFILDAYGSIMVC